MLRALPIALALVLVGLLHEPPRPSHNVRGEANNLPNADLVKFSGKPIISLLTDLFWVRMVNLGGTVRVPWEGKQLVRWGDFITDLDPTFVHAYIMGGLLGTVDVGQETYNLTEAEGLLEKGTRNLPHETRLAIFLAFIYLELEHAPLKAAPVLERAARNPNAPPYLAPLATRLYAQAGAFDAARAFAEAVASQAGDEETREFFQTRLLEVQQEELLQQIDAAADAFRRAQHREAASIDELVAAGLLPGRPIDPLGGELTLTLEGARASSRPHRLQAHSQSAPP